MILQVGSTYTIRFKVVGDTTYNATNVVARITTTANLDVTGVAGSGVWMAPDFTIGLIPAGVTEVFDVDIQVNNTTGPHEISIDVSTSSSDVDLSNNSIVKGVVTELITDAGIFALACDDIVGCVPASVPSELEKITETSQTGWRLLGRNPDNFGDIGVGAVDFSYSVGPSTTKGATGTHSFATGFNTTATSLAAKAWGNTTQAIGYMSSSFGSNTQATATNSTAWGTLTQATANQATAWGESTAASGVNATAFGKTTYAIGSQSVAWGYEVVSSSNGSTAWGMETQSSANYSTSWGSESKASGDYSTAWGTACEAAGYGSTASGSGTYAYGNQSVSWGSNTTASGGNATAFGTVNIANGAMSTVWGNNNTVNSFCATVLGPNATISTGQNAVTFDAADELFKIGNGVNSGARSDALKIYKNAVQVQGGITATAASALTPEAGMLAYVTSTNGTFTSTGFWGYEGGSWTKL